MVLQSALCFFLIAVALMAGRVSPTRGRTVQGVLGAAVLLISVTVFSQYLTGVDLGLDWAGSDVKSAANPFPGRMSGPTALSFMLCGLVMMSMHRVTGLRAGLAVQALTTLVIASGLIGIAGYYIPLHLFYGDYVFGRATLTTAAGFIIAGMLMWLSWRRDSWYVNRRLIRSQEQRIVLLGTLTLGSAVCVSAMAGFMIMVGHVERTVGSAQLDLLQRNVMVFVLSVESRIDQAALLAERPVMREQMDRLNRVPGDPLIHERLRANTSALLAGGFSAVEFSDPDGRSWISAGRFVPSDAVGAPLRARYPARLIWHDGLILHSQIPIEFGGRIVAYLKSEQPLSRVNEIMSAEHMTEHSGEIGLCTRTAAQLTCFPQRMMPRPYQIPYSKELPMASAIDGQSGTMVGRDYRGQNVLAAYGPVGDLGLGMVVKVDTSELYEPLRQNMYLVLALMVLTVLLGGLVLHHAMTPLVRKLESGEQRLQLALAGSRIALWDWDLQRGTVFLSERWAELLGEPAHPMTMRIEKLQAMVHPEDLPTLLEQLRLVFKGAENAYDLEHRIRLPDGRERWIRSRGQVAERDAQGRVLRMVGTNADISRRKEAEAQLAHQASHDALTGLPNRLFFPDRLEQAMARSRRQKSLMAVMYLDIDKFKGINDTLGHEAGDVLLKGFAGRISSVLRTTDTAIRLGGDEFVIILEGLGSRDNGAAVAEKIVAAMRTPFAVGKGTLRITTSAGLAYFEGEEGLDGDALLRKADEAMYQAKAAGRNNVKFAG